jgi:Fe-S-cluster containining protein
MHRAARDPVSFEYPRNVHFKCERCAVCCGDTEKKIRKILVLKPEADSISKKTLKPTAEFACRTEGSEPYVYEMKKTKNGRCVFLRANLCTIYSVRPLICRFYPFELRAARTDRHIFSYTNECPYVGHGPELKKEYFERLFARSASLIRNAKINMR